MIDFSICPDNPIRSGADKRGIATVVEWLNSVVALASGDDASGGAVKAALSSNKRLYVTAYQYTLANATFTCLNVMVDRRDYRLLIGFDDKVIKIENLDPRAARAETRLQAQKWAPANLPDPPSLAVEDDPADNYNTPDPIISPYGVRIPANQSPYGVMIPARG